MTSDDGNPQLEGIFFGPTTDSSRSLFDWLCASLKGGTDTPSLPLKLSYWDDKVRSGSAADRIAAETRGADVVVADLTDLRSDVLYEVGLAHGLGKPVFLFARLDPDGSRVSDQLPFHLKNHSVLRYSLDDDGLDSESRDRLKREFRRSVRNHIKAETDEDGQVEHAVPGALPPSIVIVDENDRLDPRDLYDGRRVFVPGKGRGLGTCEVLEEDADNGLRIQIRFRSGGRYVLNANDAAQPPVYLPPRLT